MAKQDQDRRVEQWVRPEIRAISAYHVPEASGLIKLDAMENPYNWPDAMRDEWLQRLREADINRYPHPGAPEVKARLYESMGIPADAAMTLGNGSDELIQMIAMALGGPGRVILSVDPSFVMYKMIAAFTGMTYVGVPLRPDDFTLDTEAVLTSIEQCQPAIVFLSYPNNPTGQFVPGSRSGAYYPRSAGAGGDR